MTVYTTMDSPLGELLLVGEPVATGGVTLTSLSMPEQKNAAAILPDWIADPMAFAAITTQLRAYFAGESASFDIEFTSGGTEFQRQVWQALDEIPFGDTISYGELTARIGVPRERVRAVAGAIGANPLLVVRPCHRVIGANGSLTGYAGGLERKQKLLALENVLLSA